jgi:hypothetical protein
MTNRQLNLLNWLATRQGIVPLRDDQIEDQAALHDLGYVAINGRFTRITAAGTAALSSTNRGGDDVKS